MPRVGLAGYVALTIVAYLVIGPYFTLGWVAKAIEVAILILLAVDLRYAFGTPAGLFEPPCLPWGCSRTSDGPPSPDRRAG